MTAFGSVIALLLGIILFQKTLPGIIAILLVLVFLIGLAIASFGFYLRFGRQVTVFDLKTGIYWQQTTLFGVPFSRTLVLEIIPIPWLGAPARLMRYPASIIEMYRSCKAAPMFTSALLQLMAQRVVLLSQVRIRDRFGRVSKVYALAPAENHATAELNGEMEKRIAEVVALSGTPSADMHYKGVTVRRSQRTFLALSDLMLLVFEGSKPQPGNWLLDEMVGPEAEQMDLGEAGGKLYRRFWFVPNIESRFSVDIRSVELLYKDFWETYPQVAQDLLARIETLMMNTVAGSVPD